MRLFGKRRFSIIRTLLLIIVIGVGLLLLLRGLINDSIIN